MRSRISFGVLVCAVLVFVSAIQVVKAAPPTDACSLLTKAQISSTVGASVSDGSHPPNFSKLCMWNGPSDGKGVRSIELSLQSADSYQAAKAMLQAVVNSPQNRSAKSPMSMTPASGIGDDALFSSVGSYTKLIVKKGDVVFQIVVYSDAPIDKKRDMEKALAGKVLSNL